VNEALISKNESLRQKIVDELEATITILKQEEQRAEIELAKTGLNTVNKFHLNKAKDDIQLISLIYVCKSPELMRKEHFF